MTLLLAYFRMLATFQQVGINLSYFMTLLLVSLHSTLCSSDQPLLLLQIQNFI